MMTNLSANGNLINNLVLNGSWDFIVTGTEFYLIKQ